MSHFEVIRRGMNKNQTENTNTSLLMPERTAELKNAYMKAIF